MYHIIYRYYRNALFLIITFDYTVPVACVYCDVLIYLIQVRVRRTQYTQCSICSRSRSTRTRVRTSTRTGIILVHVCV